MCRIEPSTTQDQQDVYLISKEGKHIVLNRNSAFVITFFLSIILIIAHITYLFERLTLASDRKERNNRVPQVWSTLLGKMRLEILIETFGVHVCGGTHYQSRMSRSHL